MQTVFGIDFGTTNSALSIYRNNKVEVVKVDELNAGSALMRSVLYFTEDQEVFAGQEAISSYINEGAAGSSLYRVGNAIKAPTLAWRF